MRQALAQDGNGGAAAAANARANLLEGGAAQRRRPHEHGLLQDQHEGGRDDIAGIAAGRIEQRLVQDLDRRALQQRRAIEAAVGAGIARQQVGHDGVRALEDALQHAIVEQEIGGIDVGRQARPAAGQNLALGARRNVEDAEDLASGQRRLRLGQRARPHGDTDRLVGIQALDEPSAQLRGIVVDDGNRHGADELPEIGLRIEHAVDQGGEDEQAQRAAIAERAAIFGGEGSHDAGPRGPFHDRRRLDRRGLSGDGSQAEPREAEERRGQCREDDQRPDRIGGGHAARGLIEQDLDVPAQRQQRSPGLGEIAHRPAPESPRRQNRRRASRRCRSG